MKGGDLFNHFLSRVVGRVINDFIQSEYIITTFNLIAKLVNFRSNNFGALLLKHVIKQSQSEKAEKVWVHTCSLDHKFALKNYLARGFKIFKKEQINFVA